MHGRSVRTSYHYGQLRDVYFLVGSADPGVDLDFIQRPG